MLNEVADPRCGCRNGGAEEDSYSKPVPVEPMYRDDTVPKPAKDVEMA